MNVAGQRFRFITLRFQIQEHSTFLKSYSTHGDRVLILVLGGGVERLHRVQLFSNLCGDERFGVATHCEVDVLSDPGFDVVVVVQLHTALTWSTCCTMNNS